MMQHDHSTTVQADFEYCEAVIKKHSKSFYAAFSQLPPEKAESVYAIYAFCRLADDLIDEEQDPEKLEELADQLTVFMSGQTPDTPVFRALSVVFDTFEMETQPFFDMLTGQSRDIDFKQPQTFYELAVYSYYVAGSVGLMLLPILSKDAQEIQEPAKKLGEAMQLTNILRDIGEDYQMGRIYLPQELMKKYDVTAQMLSEKKPTKAFIALWETLAQTAEQLYEESMVMMPQIDEECRQALLSALFLYRAQLEEIRKNNYDVFHGKTALSKTRKLQILFEVRTYLKKINAEKLHA